MEDNCGVRKTEDGFCQLDRRVNVARDGVQWRKQINGPILSEETALMSRIERRYCLASTSCMTGFLTIFILHHSRVNQVHLNGFFLAVFLLFVKLIEHIFDFFHAHPILKLLIR